MILHPDGMAQTMIEIFPVACFCDEISGGLVQITETYAGADQAFRHFIGASDQIMNRRILGIFLSAEKSTGHVGAVAVFPTAHVDNNTVLGL